MRSVVDINDLLKYKLFPPYLSHGIHLSIVEKIEAKKKSFAWVILVYALLVSVAATRVVDHGGVDPDPIMI